MNRRTIGKRRIRGLHLFSLVSLGVMFLALCISAGSQQLAKTSKPTADHSSKASQPAKSDQGEPQTQYTVGDSDVLHVNVWQEPEVTQNVVVRPDGNISLPLINEVQVSGMTIPQIQNLIAEKLKSFVNDPNVTVTVLEVHSKHVFITGEVTRPGDYPLTTQITVVQLIAQAGGLTPFAKSESIVILRMVNGAQQSLKFKWKEVMHGKNTEQNIVLQPGDTVVVP
jgi:polysaccharide export outer membrane protein